jgi:hypothetical protein
VIPDDLRTSLIDRLLDLPLAETSAGRSALLTGIPQEGYFARNPDNARGDMIHLVAQLEENFGPAGVREWRLLQLVDNAIRTVVGTELARKLGRIRQDLVSAMEGLRRTQVDPAAVAQVHLFDLRQPVLGCIAALAGGVGLAGFVLPTPTSRLLRYFCESLKHRGAELKEWTRDQVVVPDAPLQIEPLHTTVEFATAKAGRFHGLLQRKSVIWAVFVRNPGDAVALWSNVRAAFAQRRPENHMVIVFGMLEAAAAPEQMLLLPSPRFTQKDVANWLTDIARARAWQESLVQRWTAVIVRGYTTEGALPIEIVYDRLETHSSLPRDYQTEQDVLQRLEELELIGD